MSESGVPVRVEIVDILVGGECPMGLEVGQSWTIRDGHLPEEMCSSAWNSIMPFVTALRYGGTFPWSGEREIRLSCPDAANPVVFHAKVLDE